MWTVETVRDTVASLHSLDVPDVPSRLVRWCVPTDSALVLGRAQDDAIVDANALTDANIALVRRRSGGGAVLVEPDAMLWFDIVIPVDDALWRDDVNKSFHWIGNAIAAALVAQEYDDIDVHEGPMIVSTYSSDVCFAGIGPGEVLQHGAKIVGLSQRRRRQGAVFQCSVLLRDGGQNFPQLLDVDEEQRAQIDAYMQQHTTGLSRLDVDAFRSALCARLTR